MAQDPYQELGVSRSASAEELRKSYRALAKQLHPDRNAGNKVNEERFKRVTAAFDVLGDVDKRAKFDRGEIDADGRETTRGFGGGGPGGFGARFDNVDLDDILGEMFGNKGGGRGFSARGADLRVRLEIELEDAILGASKRVAFDGKTLDVVIPKGAAEGQTLRLKGRGAVNPTTGKRGDLMARLMVSLPEPSDPELERFAEVWRKERPYTPKRRS